MTEASNSITPNNGIYIANEEYELLDSLQRKLRNLSSPSSDRCIYRVPERFRERNPKAYTPKVVSIGPLHHGAANLQPMERHKREYLCLFIARADLPLESLVKWARDNEQILRASYAESNDLPSHKFLEIIIVDSAFVLELFFRTYERTYPSCATDDLIYGKPWSFTDIRHDLILLENKLPLFILVYLLAKIPQSILDFILVDLLAGIPQHQRNTHSKLIMLASLFFKKYVDDDVVKMKWERITSEKVEHFLHMLLIYYQPSEVLHCNGEVSKPVPGVFELHQAGIDFKVSSSKIISDLKFKDGVLEIPRLKMWNSTERLLRNLIAFEQCHLFSESHFRDYAVLMEWLVNTPQDAELLIRNNIINMRKGTPTEINDILVNLGYGIHYENCHYKTLCNQLNDFLKLKRHRWKANLKHNYFNSPWSAISVGAAILLLALTLLQTIFSGMAVKC